MKFRRIDDSTIRCILTEEDMVEHGLSLEDFFTDKDKTRGFLESIVKQAQEEVGYETSGDMLAMQVMPLPKNGLAITLSEQNEHSFQNMMGHIRSAIEELQEEGMSELLEGVAQEETEALPKKTEEKGKKTKQKFVRVFEFATMQTLEQFCAVIPPELNVKSELYKDPDHDDYYLIIEKGRVSMQNLERVCCWAQEFSKLISDQQSCVEYCKEHYTCILKKGAVKVLRDIAC